MNLTSSLPDTLTQADTRALADAVRLQRHATSHSAWLRPPIWRIREYYQWRRYCQPRHILDSLSDTLSEHHQPVRYFGVLGIPRTVPVEMLADGTARLRQRLRRS